ncbi:ras GEF [Neoconidiobolus thromboides FSU 785]|nr:ras GEF [Neoconidiobolus thromboides FSU 785]
MDSSEKTVTPKVDRRRSSQIVNGIDISELDFLGYDYTDEEVKYKDGMLIYATIKALVEKLTLHDSSIDSKFIETFLLTFRAFCKPPIFLDHLIERYLIKPPEGINEQRLDIWRTHKQTAVKIRVNNVLKIWLESYFYIKDDGPILEKLMTFVSGPIMECMPSVATRLLKNCESLLESYKQENESSKLAISKSMELKKASALAKLPNIPPPLPNIGKGIVKSLLTTLPFRITDLDPMEVARQLTIMDCKSFCGILPHELIGLEFSKKDSPSVKYVRMMTDTTNEITSLICDCILKEPDVKKRCNIVKYFIKVGENLLILKNYNSLIPIVGALNSSMIARLKRTWAILPPKFQQTFDQLRKATDHSKNYAEYRNVLKTTLPPCLPFLGIYLTDLTFTDEGNSAFQEGGDDRFKLVNFAKYARTVSIVQEIQKFQVPYNIIEVKELQIRIKAWLKRANEIWDEDKYYNNSLALEPRGNKQPALTTKSKQAVKELAITDKDVDLALVAYF